MAKVIIAEIVYSGALLAALYFGIRFILSFFIGKDDKESIELKAITELGKDIQTLTDEINSLK